MTQSEFSLLFALADGVPEWVHLVPAGRFSGVDGRGPYVNDRPDDVIAASMAAGRLPIDENHSTDLATPRGDPAPARGWIVAMEKRADGLWGRVEWNEHGRELLTEKAYRGLSPVLDIHRATGRVVRVQRASLTNRPNLDQLTSLNHQEPSMDLARMRTALGLAADADETSVLTAIERFAAERAASQTQVTTLQAQLTTLQATAIRPELVVELQAQLAEVQVRMARDKAVAFVDGAIKAGKPIAPLRDHYIARHTQDPASVETEIGKLPSIHAGGLGEQVVATRHDAADGDGLSDVDLFVARTMNMDRKKFAEFRKKRRAEKETA